MGCSVIYRGTVRDLYINQPAPPLLPLMESKNQIPDVFPPTGIINRDDIQFFDHKELIKQSQLIHIYDLTIYSEDYIKGFIIEYNIDGSVKRTSHIRGHHGKEDRLILGTSDYIQKIEITYDKYVNSISFQTAQGQNFLAQGKKGPGSQIQNVDFTKQKRGVVGFKGEISEFLSALYVYSWKLRDRIV
ncbi:unnamed protein product [Blepharisma stoltei]|uniref:Jacalin-type lectin domain-containing protein n=1 Tax=Blepharisma stoltei TaxID=1481888 RepID=A0AAU9KCM2_9CILI|nr:unnamed protein product [Blepharisma stoltei]